jgi:hypothetical protein
MGSDLYQINLTPLASRDWFPVTERVIFFFFREPVGNKRPKKKMKDARICGWKNRETNPRWAYINIPVLPNDSKYGILVA